MRDTIRLAPEAMRNHPAFACWRRKQGTGALFILLQKLCSTSSQGLLPKKDRGPPLQIPKIA